MSPVPLYVFTEAHWSLLTDMGEYEEALQAIAGQSDLPGGMCLELAIVYVRLGRLDEVRQ